MRFLLFSAILMTLTASASLAQGPTLPKRNGPPELPIPAQAPLPNPPAVTAQPDTTATVPNPVNPTGSLPPVIPATSPALNVPPPPVPSVQVTAEKVVVPPSTSRMEQETLPQAPVPIYEHRVMQSYPAPQRIIYHASPWGVPSHVYGIDPAGAEGVFVGPSTAGRLHVRYPYYNYRRPWYTRGPASLNVDIIW